MSVYNLYAKAFNAVSEQSNDGFGVLPKQKNQFNEAEIAACGIGKLFDHNQSARLPSGQMLVFDHISHISSDGGTFDRGLVTASLAVKKEQWFFGCHFVGDPVMPGCLMVDALWQMMGFYLLWSGHHGKGRALGAKNVRFSGQVLPQNNCVLYTLNVRKVLKHGDSVFGIGDGSVDIDGKIACTANDLRTGMFLSID